MTVSWKTIHNSERCHIERAGLGLRIGISIVTGPHFTIPIESNKIGDLFACLDRFGTAIAHSKTVRLNESGTVNRNAKR